MAKQSRQPRFYQTSKPTRKGSPSREPITLTIDRLSHDGRGIAKHQGKTTFVSGALPGEVVSAVITEQKSRFNSAMVKSVETASHERVDPQCPHFSLCGGCELQHLLPEAQIGYKQTQALDQLQRIGHCQPQHINAPLDGEAWHYRRRARLSIYCPRSHSEPVMGFRRRNEKTLVAIQQCSILLPDLEALIAPLQTWLSQCHNPQALGHIELIQPDPTRRHTVIIIRHQRPLNEEDLTCLIALTKRHQSQLFLQGEQGLQPVGETEELQYTLTDKTCDQSLKIAFGPQDFTQINPVINQKMVDQALHWLAPSEKDEVLDLFCGLGNFSLPLAGRVKRVHGVEGASAMVARAAENARLNQVHNTEFSHGDLNKLRINWQGINKVLLDPPRAGAQAVVEQLVEQPQVTDVLYVSCDPATFARDADILIQGGYRLQQWGVMNMFPHTTHVESMGLFQR